MNKLSVKLVFLVSLFWMTLEGRAQTDINTITQLDSNMSVNPKPGLIFITADWCVYCQLQKNELKKIFQKHSVGDYLYYAEFDMETKSDIVFNDIVYKYKPNGLQTGVHELAVYLNGVDNELKCPAWILIDPNYNFLSRYSGFLTAAQMQKILLQLAETYNRNN